MFDNRRTNSKFDEKTVGNIDGQLIVNLTNRDGILLRLKEDGLVEELSDAFDGLSVAQEDGSNDDCFVGLFDGKSNGTSDGLTLGILDGSSLIMLYVS